MTRKRSNSARRVTFPILLLTLLCSLCAGAQHLQVSPANLLNNPSFETGDFTGWTVTGNSSIYGVNVAGFHIPDADIPSIVLVHTGRFAGYAVVCGLFCNTYLNLSQAVNLQPGVTYSTGFWIGDGTMSALGNSVAIYVNGSPIQLTYQAQLEPGYEWVGGVFVALDSTVVIEFRIEASGQATAGVSFDDFCLSGNASSCYNPYAFQSLSFPGDIFTETLGINNESRIAGYHGRGTVDNPSHGFVLTLPNNFMAEDFPGSAQTQVVGINNAGDTSGSYVDQAGDTHGFIEIGGTFSTVDFPGTTFNRLLGLNDANEAAGYWQDSLGNQSPYTYQSGVFTSLDADLPPHASAQATGVNNAGMVMNLPLKLMLSGL